MTVQIENEFLIATIAEDGAELVSLKSKKNNIEYIWQGDPAFGDVMHLSYFQSLAVLKMINILMRIKRIPWDSMDLLEMLFLK